MKNHIIEYDGEYNFDLIFNLKNTIENLESFLDKVIKENLLIDETQIRFHETFNKDELTDEDKTNTILINNNNYLKCVNCTNFINIDNTKVKKYFYNIFLILFLKVFIESLFCII